MRRSQAGGGPGEEEGGQEGGGVKRRGGEQQPHMVQPDDVVGQTQVGLRVVSQLEGALVELRDGLVHVQDGVLLVDLTDDLDTRSRLKVKVSEPL